MGYVLDFIFEWKVYFVIRSWEFFYVEIKLNLSIYYVLCNFCIENRVMRKIDGVFVFMDKRVSIGYFGSILEGILFVFCSGD